MTIRFGQNPRYYPHNGKQLISVTSVLTLLAKNALIPWAANCAVDYILGRPADTFVTLETRRDYNTYGESVKGEWPIWDVKDIPTARTAYKQASMEAADYGTYIHTLCKYYFDTNIQITSPHEMTQKLMTSFYAWCKKHNVKPIETEIVVYGDGYAGRVDLICEIDQFWYKSKDKKDQKIGRRKRVVALIDFKTGKGSYYAEWPLQTAAYREAYKRTAFFQKIVEMCKERGENTIDVELVAEQMEGKHIEYHGVLKFSKETNKVNYKDMSEYEATRNVVKNGQFVLLPDGTYKTEKYIRTYEQDLEAFMLLVRFWNLMNEA